LRLDTAEPADGELRLVDCLRHPDPLPADTLLAAEQKRDVRREVLRLKPRERDVIVRRFGLAGQPAQTLEAIAIGFGLSKERVRQIEFSALARLRDGIAALRRAPSPASYNDFTRA